MHAHGPPTYLMMSMAITSARLTGLESRFV